MDGWGDGLPRLGVGEDPGSRVLDMATTSIHKDASWKGVANHSLKGA